MNAKMNREEMLDLCAAYALGCIDPEDRARLEAVLAQGSPEAEAALREFGEAAFGLALGVPPVAPPAELRARVLAGAHAETQAPVLRPVQTAAHAAAPIESRRSWWSTPVPGWLAAAACLAFALLQWNTAARLRRETTSRAARIAALEDERTRLESQLADEKRWVNAATASDARVATLAPTPDGDPQLRARAVVDPATRRAVLVGTHFTPPAGRDYQLWLIRDGKPRSLGVVHAGASGDVVVRLADVGDAATLAAFAVSLEPAGGAPTDDAPTGPVVLVGALGG